MARQPRSQLWSPAACDHVLNRGHARETIFHNDTDRECFLDLLARYRDRCQCGRRPGRSARAR